MLCFNNLKRKIIQFMNKRYRILKRQSRMEHPEKLASLGIVDTGRRQTTLNTKQNTKNSNTAPTNTTVSESYLLANILSPPLYQKTLEITKQSSSTCNISIFYPLTFNTDERRVGIPLIDLTPAYLYACPKIVPGFPPKYGIFVFSELR
jgi:hypothetical protein